MNLLYCCNFIIPFGTMLFPMLTTEWLHLLYYCTSLKNIMILFWKYLVDITVEVRLGWICLEIHKWKIVCSEVRVRHIQFIHLRVQGSLFYCGRFFYLRILYVCILVHPEYLADTSIWQRKNIYPLGHNIGKFSDDWATEQILFRGRLDSWKKTQCS